MPVRSAKGMDFPRFIVFWYCELICPHLYESVRFVLVEKAVQVFLVILLLNGYCIIVRIVRIVKHIRFFGFVVEKDDYDGFIVFVVLRHDFSCLTDLSLLSVLTDSHKNGHI